MSAFDSHDTEKGKVVAILGYIFFLGWIIALILHTNSKTRFGAFHLRQSLGLILSGFVVYVISFGLHVFSPLLYYGFSLINIAVFILAIIGIINAANGKMQPLPLVGEFFDKTFSGIN